MRAAVIHGPEDVRVEEVERPVPATGEVLVEITGAGICGTDAHIFRSGEPMFPADPRSQWPLVLGHEFAGRVVETGSRAGSLRVGDFVASGAGVACGSCRPCSAGRSNLCEKYWTIGIHRHGGLAEFCAVPAETCELIPFESVSDDTASLAQPMAIAEHAISRVKPRFGERVLVLGAGGIGTFAIWAAAQRGADLIVCDLDPARLSVAAELGASRLVQADPQRPLAEQLGDVGPWDVVLEITGQPEPLEAALALAGRGTRIAIVGLQSNPRLIDIRRLAVEEIELIGTVAHVCAVDLLAALRLLGARSSGWSDVAPEVLPLDDLVDGGLRPLLEGKAKQTKTLFDPRLAAPREFLG